MYKGSPPLARGKVYSQYESGSAARITPACAGKSIAIPSAIAVRRDHPRLRGEKVQFCLTANTFMGSPPLARGKVIKRLNYFKMLRDHPRLRGEKTKKIPYSSHFKILLL